jgi:hypothetical protein
MGGADPIERRYRRVGQEGDRDMTSKSDRMGKLLSGSAVGSPDNPFVLKDPLVVIFQQDGNVVCNIHPAPGLDHKHYGLVICDLVRHVTRAFKVGEDDVWKWVDKERRRPTTDITQPS